MRKSDREIKNFEEIIDVLNRCDTIRIGLFGGEYPYIVPLSFGYDVQDGKVVIYVHGAKEGLKHDLIAQNPKACIEADILHRYEAVGQSVTCIYESIIGFGTVEKAQDGEAIKGLDLLLTHCGYDGFIYDHAVTNVTTVYKIALDSITGKRRTL